MISFLNFLSEKKDNVKLKQRKFRSQIKHSNFLSYINRDAKMNSRKCEVCTVNVNRASYAKHLRSKNLLENVKQNELIRTEWLF